MPYHLTECGQYRHNISNAQSCSSVSATAKQVHHDTLSPLPLLLFPTSAAPTTAPPQPQRHCLSCDIHVCMLSIPANSKAQGPFIHVLALE
jgi:hypothetical protein